MNDVTVAAASSAGRRVDVTATGAGGPMDPDTPADGRPRQVAWPAPGQPPPAVSRAAAQASTRARAKRRAGGSKASARYTFRLEQPARPPPRTKRRRTGGREGTPLRSCTRCDAAAGRQRRRRRPSRVGGWPARASKILRETTVSGGSSRRQGQCSPKPQRPACSRTVRHEKAGARPAAPQAADACFRPAAGWSRPRPCPVSPTKQPPSSPPISSSATAFPAGPGLLVNNFCAARPARVSIRGFADSFVPLAALHEPLHGAPRPTDTPPGTGTVGSWPATHAQPVRAGSASYHLLSLSDACLPPAKCAKAIRNLARHDH